MGSRHTRIYLIAAILAMLVLLTAGCTQVRENVNMGCCVAAKDSENNTICGERIGGDPPGVVDILYTNFCDPASGMCNVHYGSTIVTISTSYPIQMSDTQAASGCTLTDSDMKMICTSENDTDIPICSDRTTGCLAQNCYAQVCGPMSYRPSPVPSLADSVTFTKESQSTGNVPNGAQAVGSAGGTERLYNASCLILRTDENLTAFLKNSKGSAINIFRFGVGTQFGDFDKYRFLFPFTDSYCNINPFIKGARDRFMNYMLTPQEFQQKRDQQTDFDNAVNGSQNALPFQLPWQKVDSEDFCPSDINSSYLGPLYSGMDIPNYNFNRNELYSQYISCSRTPQGDIASCSAAPEEYTGYSNVELDKKFYANFLQMIYENELSRGLQSVGGTPVPAPFECENGMECSSGFCDQSDYSRGLCLRTDASGASTWVQCSCTAEARTCYGGTQLMQYPNDVKPTTGAKLQEYISDYLRDGTEFYIRQEGNLTANLAMVNPACDLGSIDGVDGITDRVKNCYYTTGLVTQPGVQGQVLYGPKFKCPDILKKDIYRVTCAYQGSSTSLCTSSLLSLNNTPWTCTNSSGVKDMSCSSSGPFSVSDCTNYGTSIVCAAKSVTCSISNPDAGNNQYDATCSVSQQQSQYMSLTSCTYYDANPRTTLTCTEAGSTSFNDCVNGSDSSFNDKNGQPTLPAGTIMCSQDPNLKVTDLNGFTTGVDSFRFPQDVQFFGQIQPGNYVGYTLLPEPEFAKSDFYTACHLQNVTDYDVIPTLEMEKGWGNSEAVSAFYGGTVFRPPAVPGTDPFAPGGYLALGDVPQIIGSQRIFSGGECNMLSDNAQEMYLYVPQFIYIKIKQNANGNMSIGDCNADPTTGLPITKSFGWCDACSYLTIAEQKYDPNQIPAPGQLIRTYKDFAGTMNYTVYNQVMMGYSGEYNATLNPAGTQIDNYMREGVLPVYDLSDPGMWADDPTANRVGAKKLRYGFPINMTDGPGLYILGNLNDDYDLRVVDITLTPRFHPDTNVYTLETKVDDGSGTIEYGQLFFDNPNPVCCPVGCPLDVHTQRCTAGCGCQTPDDCVQNTCDPENAEPGKWTCQSDGQCVPNIIYKGNPTVSLAGLRGSLGFQAGPSASFSPPGPSLPSPTSPSGPPAAIGLPGAPGGITPGLTSSTVGASCDDYDPVTAWPVNVSKQGTAASVHGGYTLDFSGSGLTPATGSSDAIAGISIVATKDGADAGSASVCVTDQPVEFQMTLYGQGADATHQSMADFANTFKARVDGIRHYYTTGVFPQPSNLVIQHVLCPPNKCIVGFRLLDDAGGKTGDDRLAQNILTMRELNLGFPYQYSIDLNETDQFVDFSFYPREFTDTTPGICGAGSDLNNELFTRLESLPKAALAEQKLSLIDGFYVDTDHSTCWTDAKRVSFLSYLFAKQKSLSTSGLMGIIYSDTSRLNGSIKSVTDTFGNPVQYAMNSKEYCGLQQGSRWYTSDIPVTVYSKIYTAKTMCEQCQDIDVVLGTCTTKCANNVDCEMPTDSSGAPLQGAFKCPDNSVPEPCMPCNQSTDVLSCKFYRSDGSTDSSTFNISDLNELSPDIISSIPSPSDDVCCLSDTGGNYTYIKQSTAGKNTAPMVFSLSGDPNQDCGIPDISSLSVQMCGASTPIKDYKVECSLYNPQTGILTTKKGKWYIRSFPWTASILHAYNIGELPLAGGGFTLPGPGPVEIPGGAAMPGGG